MKSNVQSGICLFVAGLGLSLARVLLHTWCGGKVKVGDLVRVETKFHGKRIGIIIEDRTTETYGPLWLVHIPGHTTTQTLSLEKDMEMLN